MNCLPTEQDQKRSLDENSDEDFGLRTEDFGPRTEDLGPRTLD